MTKLAVTILSGDILNRLWWNFLSQERTRLGKLTRDEEYAMQRQMGYGYFNRKGRKCERFEQWLFSQGAEVRRVAGQFHLEFTDNATATIFALKYS